MEAKTILEALEWRLSGSLSDTSNFFKWIRTLSDNPNPIQEKIAQELYEKRQFLKNEYDLYKSEHDELLKKVKEEIRRTLGRKPNKKELFDWMYEKDEEGKYTGKFISDDNIETLSEAKREYITFVKRSIEKLLLDAYKGDKDKMKWYNENRDFVPRFMDPNILYVDEETGEKIEKGSRGLLKRVGDAVRTAFNKDTWKDIYNAAKTWNLIAYDVTNAGEDGLLRVYGLPTEGIDPSVMSYDMEYIFHNFAESTLKKKHLDDLLQKAYIGLVYLTARRTVSGNIAKNNIEMLEHIIVNKILGKRDEIGLELRSSDGKLVISADRILSYFNSWVNLCAMGLNFESALVNFIQGFVKGEIESFANKYGKEEQEGKRVPYGPGAYNKASAIVLGDLGNIAKNVAAGITSDEGRTLTKVELLMDKFQVMDSKFMYEGRHGLASKDKGLMKNLLIFHRASEYTVRAILLVAQMIQDGTWDDYEVKDGKLVFTGNGRGKTWTDEKLEWRSKFSKPVSALSDQELTKEDYRELTVEEVRTYLMNIDKISGAMRADEAPMIYGSIIGRMLMAFKSWMPETMSMLWGPHREKPALAHREFIYDEEGNIIGYEKQASPIEGAYLTLWELLRDPKMTIKKFKQIWKEGGMRKRNLVRMMGDFMVLLTIYGVGMSLIDPEEKRKRNKKGLVRLWDRSLSEIGTGHIFFAKDAFELVDNPFIQTNQINHMLNFARYTFLYPSDKIFGVGETINQHTGYWKGWKELIQMVPLSKPVAQVHEAFTGKHYFGLSQGDR